jgi:hypothetical protein
LETDSEAHRRGVLGKVSDTMASGFSSPKVLLSA